MSSPLFIDKTIEIHASASDVWDALTKPENTDIWAMEFKGGNPFHISSTWDLGSPVLWKDDTGAILVEGHVTKVESNKFLTFTVSNTSGEKHTMTFAYELENKNETTLLHIREGDFAVVPDGKKYFEANKQVWDKVLPKIKELAEKMRESV